MPSMHTYHRRKAEGLCVWCGEAPASDGRVACAACRRRKVEKQLSYLDRLRLEGLCLACREKLDGHGPHCTRCRAKIGVSVKALYERRREQGVCIYCGGELSLVSTYRCDPCIDRQRACVARRRSTP
jgi:hypothetical protein